MVAGEDRKFFGGVLRLSDSTRASHVTMCILIASLIVAEPQSYKVPQLSFLEFKVLIEGDGRSGSPVVPSQLKAHFDRKIRLRGYISPTSMIYDTADQFVLWPDNQYNTGQGPSDARQSVLVRCTESVKFTGRPITIEGTFRHREIKDDGGVVLACLAIDDAEVVADKPEVGIRDLLKTFRQEFVQIAPGEGKFPAEMTIGEGKTTNIKLSKPFYIAKYEVPQNLWEAVMGENPSKWKGNRNSVEMLDFEDAQAFCAKVTRYLREARLISERQVVRLPSEAEWEYCTRAGTATRFSFGDDVGKINDYAWHTENAAGNDPPVGAKAPNPWGLYDAHGYLWEWCADAWTDDIAKLPTDGTPYSAPGDEAAKVGVLRGGSWKDKPADLASGFRRRAERSLADDAVGLRCVLAEEAAR
jgi:formylglycine-generating enzyme required for sulfatase activity